MTTQVRRAVASAVRSESRRLGVDLVDLARRSGIADDAWDARLAGDEDFTVGELASVADALGIPIARLMPTLPKSGTRRARRALHPDRTD